MLALVVIVLGIVGLIVVTLQEPAPSLDSQPLSPSGAAPDASAAVPPTPAPTVDPATPPLEPATPEPATPEPERPAPEPTPPLAQVAAPERAPSPAPVEMPDDPVSLAVSHRPLKRGQAGSSDLISARVEGPGGTRVVLHYGPRGGPFEQLPLRAKSGGRFEEWLNFPPSPGATLEYWLVATHPAAPSSAGSGSSGNPHRLVLE